MAISAWEQEDSQYSLYEYLPQPDDYWTQTQMSRGSNSYSASAEENTKEYLRLRKTHHHESVSVYICIDMSLKFIFQCIQNYNKYKVMEIGTVTTRTTIIAVAGGLGRWQRQGRRNIRMQNKGFVIKPGADFTKGLKPRLRL